MAQSRILLFWYCTTYLLLEKKRPKYQPLEAPFRDKVYEVLPSDTTDEKRGQPLSEQIEVKEQPIPEKVEGKEEPLSKQVEEKEELESQADQIRPFVLEGL